VPREGAPYLVPLSFDWEGGTLLVATPPEGPTGRNLAATPRRSAWLGNTRGVSMIDGEAEVREIDALSRRRGTGPSRTRASTRVRWPCRSAGCVSPRVVSRLGEG
jgi:hypothetical protein